MKFRSERSPVGQLLAYTAARFDAATCQWQEILAKSSGLGLAHRPRLVVLGGGLPIHDSSGLLDGIGVSGASEDEDTRCAEAGLTALGLSDVYWRSA